MSSLIDIVFILLIFFVVTTVFVDDPGVEVKVPQAGSAEELKKESVFLAVTSQGEVFYGGRSIGVDGVKSLVAAQLAADPNLSVIIKGDVAASYGLVMRVNDEARRGGAKNVYSATAK